MPKNGGRRSRVPGYPPPPASLPLLSPLLALARTSQRQRRPQSPVKTPWRLSGQRTLIPWPKAIGTFLFYFFRSLGGRLFRNSVAITHCDPHLASLFARSRPGIIVRTTFPSFDPSLHSMKTPREDGLYVLGRAFGTMDRPPGLLFQERTLGFVNCSKGQHGHSRREPKTRASSDADISLPPSDGRPTNKRGMPYPAYSIRCPRAHLPRKLT